MIKNFKQFHIEAPDFKRAIDEGYLKQTGSGGGLALTSGEIESENYTADLAGWKLDSKGDAFFNNITAQGAITATTGAIGGWVIGATDLSTSTDSIILDSTNQAIYIAKTSGYSLDLELSSSQYASITDASQTGLDITGDFTIEAIIKIETLPSVIGTLSNIVAKWNAASQRSYRMYIGASGDLINVQFSDDGTVTSHSSRFYNSTALTAGTWVHIAASVDVSVPSAAIYINGVPDTVGTALSDATSVFNSTANVYVGASLSGGSPVEFFDGLIKEVRIWNDIRTPAEILANMNKQLSGDEAGLVALYNFENNANDKTSNSNNLTLSGSPVYSTDIPTFTPYFENNGVQIEYNSGTPRFYVGDGNNQFFEFDGTNAYVNNSSLSFNDIFGDGSDGDLTVTGTTTLTSDVQYDNVTIDSGGVLNPAGYRVYIKNKLLVRSGGTLARNGNSGGNGGNGGASGGTAGTAGAVLANGTIVGGLVGCAGGVGGDGDTEGGFDGVNGSNSANSLGVNGVAGGTGGLRRVPNTPAGGGSGGGGTAGTVTETLNARNVLALSTMHSLINGTVANINGSASSGGGGGGDGASDGGNSYGGGGGGGSGSCGGVGVVFAKIIVNYGTISFNGGNGGNGGNGSTGSGCGGGAGGAGGSGGVLALTYSSLVNNGTISVAGGTKGTGGLGSTGAIKGANGENGTDGNTGTLIQIVV